MQKSHLIGVIVERFQNTNRNIALDILKLVMSFMIVALHAGFLSDISSLANYLTTNGIFRMAVPVFLLINGYYFLPVLSANNSKAWFKRVIILYIIWMALYSYYWFTPPGTTLIGIAKFTKTIVIGYFHLWYISGLIGAAVLFSVVINTIPKLLYPTIIFTFITGVGIEYLGNYHMLAGSVFDKLFNLPWVHRNFLFFSYPFFCIGYLIHKHDLHKKISHKATAIVSIAGMLLLVSESWYNYQNPSRDGGVENFFSLIIVCPSILILFLKYDIMGNSKLIGLYSSGIYFTHTFFIHFFRNYTDFRGTALTVVTILGSTLLSSCLIKLNRRVRYLL